MEIQISYNEIRIAALRMFLGDENTTVEKELSAYLDKLWNEKVPENVREYIERSERQEQAEKLREKKRAYARASAAKKPVSASVQPEGTDTRSAEENAT